MKCMVHFKINVHSYLIAVFYSYDIMLRCWNCEPTKRPTFEALQNELDPMLSAEQRDQYIQINAVDEPYCQMFPAQSNEVCNCSYQKFYNNSNTS